VVQQGGEKELSSGAGGNDFIRIKEAPLLRRSANLLVPIFTLLAVAGKSREKRSSKALALQRAGIYEPPGLSTHPFRVNKKRVGVKNNLEKLRYGQLYGASRACWKPRVKRSSSDLPDHFWDKQTGLNLLPMTETYQSGNFKGRIKRKKKANAHSASNKGSAT